MQANRLVPFEKMTNIYSENEDFKDLKCMSVQFRPI